MKLCTNFASKSYVSLAILMVASASFARALLVQPYNYMLDDSAIINEQSQSDTGSLSPFYNDQSGSSEQNADKDIVSIVGERLASMRFARMLDNQQRDDAHQHQGHFSQEMAEMIQREQQEAAANKQDGSNQEPSLSSAVANMLVNVAQAAASAATNSDDSVQDQTDSVVSGSSQANSGSSSSSSNNNGETPMSSRGSIMELDTSPSSAASVSAMPSKADLKNGPMWFNPKETIPVLKISSMGKLNMLL